MRILLLLVVLWPFRLTGSDTRVQNSTCAGDVFKEIENAVAVGNARQLSLYMSSSLELDIPGGEGVYSKSQAEQILNRFFNKYPPVSFTLSHKGNSAAGAKFAVGDYVTIKEQTFRVTIFLKKSGEHYLMHEIEFQ